MSDDPRFAEADAVLGVGGGSVMDSAKALAMLAANGGILDDYLGNTPRRTIEKPGLPLVLIPTTAGTGSEVTKVGVYTAESGRKFTLGSPLMLAKTAVLAGGILGRIPPALAASTGLDALDHALESIWNKNADDRTRKMAVDAACEVLTWLPQVYDAALAASNGEPVDEARFNKLNKNMLRASCMAGAAFSITGTAAGHALSFVLSEDWHVPHGTACAFTLLDILDYVTGAYQQDNAPPDCIRALDSIVETQYGAPNGMDWRKKTAILRQEIEIFMKKANIPQKFADLGVQLNTAEVDSHFSRAFDDPKMWNQVPKATKENMYPILYRKCADFK
jgi:alcohol dehydrogenase class IV